VASLLAPYTLSDPQQELGREELLQDLRQEDPDAAVIVLGGQRAEVVKSSETVGARNV